MEKELKNSCCLVGKQGFVIVVAIWICKFSEGGYFNVMGDMTPLRNERC